jgi:diaminopimelate decarboxylase
VAHAADPTTFTPYFCWERGEVVCEGVSLCAIARRFGTPSYVYSSAAIRVAYGGLDRALAQALGETPHMICYAVKANSNLGVLKLFAKLGSGFDIVSGGELERLRRAGVAGERIVFSGVGKTREEIAAALQAGVRLVNAESAAELEAIASEASRLRRAAPCALRVNPDVAAGAHPHISTGKHQHKFGVDWPQARKLYLQHAHGKWISWQGISAHIGSQVLNVGPYRTALRRLAGYVRDLASRGVVLKYFDVGGGLGVRYTNEKPFSFAAYAQALAAELRGLGCEILVEPGRAMVAQAGVLLMRVLYTKETGGKPFVVVDAAMNDFMRPALYDAVHPITSITKSHSIRAASRGAARKNVAIVGPVCETGDVFLDSWPLAPVRQSDVLALWGAGAYGFSQASNYNSRPRPVEIMVEGARARVIRKRETLQEMLAFE